MCTYLQRWKCKRLGQLYRYFLFLKPSKGYLFSTVPLLDNNKLLSPYQLGFRKKHSTTSAVFHLTDAVRKCMDKGKLTGALFIDLQKALDTVDHQSSLSKLPYYGMENSELRWISHTDLKLSPLKRESVKKNRFLFGVPY